MKKYLIIVILFIFIASCLYCQQMVSIGKSVQGRSINMYKYGSGNDIIIIVGGTHGNEENTTFTANKIIEKLKNNELTIPKSKSIWIIPLLNPDGMEYGRRVNARDVDINRNFLTDNWQPTYVFYNNELSAGAEPFSEPESLSIKNLFDDIRDKKVVVLSLHSAGDAIIPGNNSDYNNKLVNILYNDSHYNFNTVGYTTFGDMTSYLSNKLNIAAVTIEFKTKNKPETSEIVKVIDILSKLSFEDKIYNSDKSSIVVKNYEEEELKLLLNGMNDKTRNKIMSSNDDKELFFKYFYKIKNKQELLILVNKTKMISKNYVPKDLVTLKKEFKSNKSQYQLRKIILNDLKNMFLDADKENIELIIISAYRSYSTQAQTFEGWRKKLGEKEALRVSAKPGQSQHQLGTAIDFNSLDESFENTKEGRWLYKNAYKYGFVMSFPKNLESVTGFKYEPWHYRYIGKEAAYLVYNYFDGNLEEFLSWYWAKIKEE